MTEFIGFPRPTRWFGNLRLRPDVPVGVPRPRYSYPAVGSRFCPADSELSWLFCVGGVASVANDITAWCRIHPTAKAVGSLLESLEG